MPLRNDTPPYIGATKVSFGFQGEGGRGGDDDDGRFSVKATTQYTTNKHLGKRKRNFIYWRAIDNDTDCNNQSRRMLRHTTKKMIMMEI